jgi:hypothetical protein
VSVPGFKLAGRILGGFLTVAIATSSSQAQSSERPTGFPSTCTAGEVRVMLLGAYHFANPGHDDIKREIDDVLKPKRQAELKELTARLARWQPDIIAVEWPISFFDSTQVRYARYRAGTLSPSRNEVVQIGFRLASHLGHSAVYPIDDDSSLGQNDSLRAVELRHPEFKHARDSMITILQARSDSQDVWMRKTTIVEHLRRINSDKALHDYNSFGMFGGYLAVGEGNNYGGAQFLADWYARNFDMAHNLTRIARPGVKRILVIVGAGHVPPLRNILDEAPQFCPVSPLPYLR